MKLSTIIIIMMVNYHVQVLSVSTTSNATIAAYREIPLDKNNCPGGKGCACI